MNLKALKDIRIIKLVDKEIKIYYNKSCYDFCFNHTTVQLE